METIEFIPIEKIIVNQCQPAEFIDQAQVLEIAESLKRYRDNGTKGLLQVPLARRVNGYVEEAFGRHRLLAFQHLAKEDPFWSEMPLVIRDFSDQEMFELMAIENLKRRDITIVEKARLFQDYMTRFDKNSEETAAAFGVSPEMIRGTVRLNHLPDEAKDKLAKGEITITTARSLLSMQKVVPQEALLKIVDQVVKGESKWGMEMTPDEIIEDAMEKIENVKELWSGSGKPRAGRHDAWLLDMKNFPNRFLPVLTPVDAALALGIQDNEEALQLVGEFLEYVDDKSDAFTDGPHALDQLAQIDPALVDKLNHLIKPPACSTCPFHTVVQESHYCGMEICFDRKTRAWEYEKLRAASKDLKIEIYNAQTDGEFRVLEDEYTDNGKKHMDLFRKRDKDLRLALAVDIDRKKPQSGYQGVPSGSVVMLVGKTLRSLLETGQKERAQKRTKEQAAAQLQSLRTVKREELDWEIAGHVKTIFDSLNLAALQALWDLPRYNSNYEYSAYNRPTGVARPSTDDKISVQEDFWRQLFAMNMVRRIGGYYNKTLSEYLVHVNEEVKRWGMKLPRSVAKLAQTMDEEIAAVTAETEQA